jgi:hypothetical protein
LICEGTDNFKNKLNLIKEKFGGSSNNDSGGTIAFNELKKLDLFDLGIVLMVTATGGFEILSEEVLSQVGSLSNSCCLMHAL